MKTTKPTSYHPNPPHLWIMVLCVVSLKLLATPLLLSTVLPSLTRPTRLITSEHFPSLSLVWVILLLFSQWGHCVLFSLGEGYLSLLLSSIVLLFCLDVVRFVLSIRGGSLRATKKMYCFPSVIVQFSCTLTCILTCIHMSLYPALCNWLSNYVRALFDSLELLLNLVMILKFSRSCYTLITAWHCVNQLNGMR